MDCSCYKFYRFYRLVGWGYYFVVTLQHDGALVVHSSWRVVVLRFYMCCLATGVSLWL